MLILMGFQGCGKSYYGKLLAEKLGWSFIDTDEMIIKKVGCSCRDFWLREGERAFREVEGEVILSLRKEKKRILSLGGGTLLSAHNQKVLEKLGHFVYLQTDKATLKERWQRADSFEAVYQSRIPLYEGISSFWIATERKSEEEILWELMDLARSFES